MSVGQWAISVVGQGIHHNGHEGDVDKLLEEFISKLRKSQTVVHHSITIGSRYSVSELADGPSLTPEAH
jgi:hypothetical protein